MRPLRLTPQGQDAVAKWRREAPEAARQRIDELLRTLDDGSWDARWWHQPYSSAPEVLEVRPDTHLHVFLSISIADDDHMEETADILQIIDSTHF